MIIYKICHRAAWQQAANAGVFKGAEIDLQDGFIHFSTAETVRETAAKHFAGQQDLVLVAVDSNQLGTNIKWEVSRGGVEFPHLYDQLDVGLVRHVVDLPLKSTGVHDFADHLESSPKSN